MAEVPPVKEVEALPDIEALVPEVPPVAEAELRVIKEPVAEAELPAVEEPEEEALPVEEAELPAIEEPEEEAPPAVEAELPAIEEPVEAAPPVAEVAEGPSRVDELEAQLGDSPRDYGARLELARLHRDGQDWNAALAQYEKLVSARKLLPEVRGDLEAMVEGDVAQAQVYQLLGDIDMQQDRLDSALEMYRLARQSLAKR